MKARTLITLRELIEEIAGGPVRGSWWAHPRGKEIFRAANALEDSGDWLVTKWVAGKTTFVHRKLWPALYRVVTDEVFQKEARRKLPRSATPKQLGDALLLHSAQVHSSGGKHVTVTRPWPEWADAKTKRAAAKLSYDEALAMLPPR